MCSLLPLNTIIMVLINFTYFRKWRMPMILCHHFLKNMHCSWRTGFEAFWRPEAKNSCSQGSTDEPKSPNIRWDNKCSRCWEWISGTGEIDLFCFIPSSNSIAFCYRIPCNTLLVYLKINFWKVVRAFPAKSCRLLAFPTKSWGLLATQVYKWLMQLSPYNWNSQLIQT